MVTQDPSSSQLVRLWAAARRSMVVAIVGGITLASGATTIAGAMRLLPGYYGIVGGASLQLALVALGGGWMLAGSPVRRFLASVLFLSASVYSSWYQYEEMLNAEERQAGMQARALAAHSQLVSQALAEQETLDTKSAEIERLRALKEDEKLGERGKPKGCGKDCRGLIARREELEAEVAVLKPIVAKAREATHRSVNDLSPGEIHQSDLRAWIDLPASLQARIPKPVRDDYEHIAYAYGEARR